MPKPYNRFEDTLTRDQVKDAVNQVKVHCDLAYHDHYRPLSMRGALYELGYDELDAGTVIAKVAEAGFDYCLDPEIAATHYDPNNPKAVSGMVTDYPSPDACHWGPDQLKSRLEAVEYQL